MCIKKHFESFLQYLSSSLSTEKDANRSLKSEDYVSEHWSNCRNFRPTINGFRKFTYVQSLTVKDGLITLGLTFSRSS